MIFRRHHTKNFTTIGNALFEDERLAPDELGILTYLLSRPHDWEVRRPALMRRFRVGPVGLKRIVNNWMRTGWARAHKVRLPNGTFHVVYEIHDEAGGGLTDEQIREALSLVSSEAFDAAEVPEWPIEDAEIAGNPPPSERGVADHPLATTYVVDKKELNTDLPRKDSTQKPEREDAAGHDRKARFIAAFEMRWPTAATDDRAHTARAARELPDDQEEAALKGIGPFLDKLKHDGRKTVPAGWRYLEQMPWMLLDQKPEGVPHSAKFDAGSAEAKAIAVLFAIADKSSFFYSVIRGSDGMVRYPKRVVPQLLALAQAPAEREWIALDHKRATAWDEMLQTFITVSARQRLQQGAKAPWPWPPSASGKIYASTGPPETLLTAQDVADLDQLKAV